MKIDFRNDPALAQRYAVVDADTQEQIEHVAWADVEAGLCATYLVRDRTLADRPGADLRLRDSGGCVKLATRSGSFEIVDLHESPWKHEMLVLLDDPDVRNRLKALVAEALVESVTQAREMTSGDA